MDLVRVKKDNKVLYVPEERLNYYLREGYDQINDQGEIVKRATSGRMVPIAEYNRVVEELEKAKTLIKQLQEGKPDVAGEAGTEEAEDPEGESKRRRRKG